MRPSRQMLAGMMPALPLPGEMMPGQFGPISRVRGTLLEKRHHAQHVHDRNAFGDADDERDAGVGGFHDRVGRKRRRHEDHRRVGAGFLHRVGHGVEDRPAFVRRAALARRDAADDGRCDTPPPPWRETCLRVRSGPGPAGACSGRAGPPSAGLPPARRPCRPPRSWCRRSRNSSRSRRASACLPRRWCPSCG